LVVQAPMHADAAQSDERLSDEALPGELWQQALQDYSSGHCGLVAAADEDLALLTKTAMMAHVQDEGRRRVRHD
jgi:hypothetical protein